MKYQNNSTNKPKTKRVYELFLDNHMKTFNSASLGKLFNIIYFDKINYGAIPSILSKLWKKGKIIRTKTQMSKGYCYSLKNKPKLDELYYHYLLPYEFTNEELINLIEQNKFSKLGIDSHFNFNKIYPSNFLVKYNKNHLIQNNIDIFLAKLVAFIMGDGHIKKNRRNIYFYFKHLEDAKKFITDFKSIFYKEKIKIIKPSFCYEAIISRKCLGKFLEKLGAPVGNKVTRPFLIPDWIYFGSNNIKKVFLSVIYGNEGSKPQDNRWRIQFVISKNKENIKNLLIFLNQIRAMLNHFDISTSYIQLRKQKGRQFCGRFYIKGKENLHKFYKLLEFSYASEKQKVLESLILEGNSFGVQHVMIR